MSTGKRNLREVLDAGIDIGGGSSQNEQPDASIMVGFTTRIVQFYSQFSSSTSLFYTVYSIFADSNGNFPEKDGIVITGATANWTSSPINVGFRHYHQQMQAMKGRSVAGDEGSTPPSGEPSGVVAAGLGNGTYKTTDISLGNMRGFKYHTSFLGTHPSTTGTTEHLFESGEVSIGSTS